MSHDLTRWIEAADERRFGETVMFERDLKLGERHFMHLGEAIAHLPGAIAHLPMWLRHSVSHHPPLSVDCRVVPFVRRPADRQRQ